MNSTISLAMLVFLSAAAFPATIYVPDHHATIQGALDASVNGDRIVVRPGTYVETIDFKGKAVTLESENGPAATVIDGNRSGSVVAFKNGERSTSVLAGFTITNGSGTKSGIFCRGGGIYCEDSSPSITGNNIIENSVLGMYGGGGGIFSGMGSSPTITGNRIADNRAESGGGISALASLGLTIAHNTIVGNEAIAGGGVGYEGAASQVFDGNYIGGNGAESGGGIYCGGGILPTLSNNIITGNRARERGGGIFCFQDSCPTFLNCTIWANRARISGGGIYCRNHGVRITNSILRENHASIYNELHGSGQYSPIVTYCNVKGGRPGLGNIDADPLFVDAPNGDLHISWLSPCRNAGDNSFAGGPRDREGDPRIAHGTVDIGADEFHCHLYRAGAVIPGAPIRVTVVGLTGLPVLLAQGLGVQDPPQPTPHGDFWLSLPLGKKWAMGITPADGVLSWKGTVPSSWRPGSKAAFQSLVGPWGGKLTRLSNLLELTVE